MAKLFWGQKPALGNRAQSKKDAQEYGKGKEDIIICPECHCVYYYKSWHHNMRQYKNLTPTKRVAFEFCPADEMKKSGRFEGDLVVKNFPANIKSEILNLIENVADRAYDRDPMDRILSMHTGENRIEVKTSENQLALNLGRQVQRAHKNSSIENKFSKEESVVRVYVSWPE